MIVDFEVEKRLIVDERVRLWNEWFETEEKEKYYIYEGGKTPMERSAGQLPLIRTHPSKLPEASLLRDRKS
jgi:hypothetical protein